MDDRTNITIKNNEAEQTSVAPADKPPKATAGKTAKATAGKTAKATAGKTPKDRAFKPLVLVPEKARLLHTRDRGTQVWVARCSDRKKINFYFYVVSTDGEVSEPVAKPLTKLTDKKGFDFLMDMEGDFDKQDTDTIRNNFNNIVKDIPIITVNTKTPISAIYKVLCDEVKVLAVAKGKAAYRDRVLDVRADGTYGNIPVDKYKSLFEHKKKEEEWIGWTELSVKQELERLGRCHFNPGRKDYTVEPGRRAISIKLPEGWCYTK